MGIAASAVSDLAGPPPPRAAANAGDDNDKAPSFQDHVDANDQPAATDAASRGERSDRLHGRSAAREQSAETQANDQSEDAKPADEARQHQPQQHADAKSAPAPLFLQLLANLAASPKTGATTNQLNAAAPPSGEAQTQAQSAQAQSAQAASPQAATIANALALIKINAKAEAGTRAQPTKSAKAAAAKTEAVETTATQAAGETPQAPDAASGAAPGAAPAAAALTAPVIASVIAPVIAPGASPVIAGAPNAPKAEGAPHADAIEGVQAAPTRAAQDAPRQAPPLAGAPPFAAPDALFKANATEAKPRDEAKALSQADALKQAAQDFAPAAPKAQAPPPSAPPPAASLQAQLAAPAAQAIGAGSTDARTQTAPVAAQVSGEIVRRFNGQDTSFQLRLDPPDLGRVDVRLDVSRDHRVTAVISADNPQALNDLARGARDLQQALQSAGLDLADDGLRFDLSSNGQGNGFAQAQAQQDQSNFRTANAPATETLIAPQITATRPLSIDSWRGARVDVMA